MKAKLQKFVVLLLVLVAGVVVGSVLTSATSDVPENLATALAKEQYAGAPLIRHYAQPAKLAGAELLTTWVFLICGVEDDALHEVRVSGTATTPEVTDLGIVKGAKCTE